MQIKERLRGLKNAFSGLNKKEQRPQPDNIYKIDEERIRNEVGLFLDKPTDTKLIEYLRLLNSEFIIIQSDPEVALAELKARCMAHDALSSMVTSLSFNTQYSAGDQKNLRTAAWGTFNRTVALVRRNAFVNGQTVDGDWTGDFSNKLWQLNPRSDEGTIESVNKIILDLRNGPPLISSVSVASDQDYRSK